MPSPRICLSCLSTEPHSGFQSKRSQYCRKCSLEELERQNADYKVSRKGDADFKERTRREGQDVFCIVCKQRGSGHSKDCLWNPSRNKRGGSGLKITSSYVPKARYEYRCSNNHVTTTNLPPDTAFCIVQGCRVTELTLLSTVEAQEPKDEVKWRS